MEIVPNQYNPIKAKWVASVRWLLAKAGGGTYPAEYGEPFVTDNKGELGTSDVVVSGLTSADVYHRACGFIFQVSCDVSQGHSSVIQQLSRRGFSVADFDGVDDVERLLMISDQLHHVAHMSLIDALMMAWCSSVASVDRIVQAVRKFATFSASRELPITVEDSMLFWLNKSMSALHRHVGIDTPVKQMARLYELADGLFLASAVSFYCSSDLPFDAIQSSVSDSDSKMTNLRQVIAFCQQQLPTTICHLSLADLLYCANELRQNIVTFVVDLFDSLETIAALAGGGGCGGGRSGSMISGGGQVRPNVVVPLISETTKRSFNQSSPVGQDQHDSTRPHSAVISSRQPLLPRRQLQNTPLSGTEEVHRPVEAWPSRPQTRADGSETDHSAASSSLLSNVEIDASLDFDSRDVALSAALMNLEAANLTSRSDPKHRTSNHVAEQRFVSTQHSVPTKLDLEPLQPARLRPAKEKTNSDSKQLESGEVAGKRLADTSADDGVNNASECSTPSDSYQTPGGSPQREAPASLPQRLTYDMTASSERDPSHSYVVHGESDDFIHCNADSNRLQMSTAGKLPLQSALKLDNSTGERTSFANIRKWKERSSGSLESPVIYNQRGSPPNTMSKSVYVVHPAQTTWMEAARIQRSASDRHIHSMAEVSDGGLAPSQMAGLKMKLEEKRRMIQSGKRKVEQQSRQQQQQVGNEAFVQMMRKRDRQPDGNFVTKSTTPLSAGNVRSASIARCQTVADGSPTSQQAVSKDATFVRPSKDVTQPVLSAATLAKAKDSTKVTNSQTPTGVAPTVTSAIAQQRGQSDVVDAALQDRKNQSQVLTSLQATPNKSAQLDPPQGMSFDRLSTSLSDLQRELSRLTQQQDEIKHLVSGGSGANGTAGSEHTPFFLYPTSGQSVSTTANSIQTAAAGTVIPPPSTQPPPLPHPYPSPAAYPIDPRLYVPEYGTYPPHYSSHHHHIASSLPPAGAMYPGVPPLTHRYPGSGPYMAPYPADPMSGMYRSPGMPPTAASDIYPMHWPPGHAPHTYYMSSPYVDHARHSMPGAAVHTAPPVPPHTVSMPAHSSREPITTAPVPSPPLSVRDVPTSPPTAFFVSTASVSEQSKPASSEAQSPLATSPATTSSTPVTQATAFFIDTSTIADSSPDRHSSVSSTASPAPASTQHATAFFVSTSPSENSVPLTNSQEPSSQHSPITRTVTADQKDSDIQPSVTGEQSTVETEGSVVLPPAEVAASCATADAKQPVVFVIGQDEESIQAQAAAEMEKRRQKLQEQQMKRREEQEQRRIALEDEMNRKREAQKSKQEDDERRKADDKARRDAIFEKYIKRKMAVEGNVESEASPPGAGQPFRSTPPLSHVVIRRKLTPGRMPSARPMSQPPPAHVVGPAALTSHGSNENLTDGSQASCISHSSERLNSSPDVRDAAPQLSHGGLTHRRPQTPERSSHYDGTPASGAGSDNYAGPKLYVKPTQKSNRSIIINAVSHCCLAGHVNKDKVDKALEEINKSTAMQFVILFRDAGMQYRALYVYNPDDAVGNEIAVTKIHGHGPKLLSSKNMERFYKYNCGAKNFTEVTSTKHLTTTIDAVTITNSIWLKYRTAAPATSRKNI